jgi:gamma-glutamylcyclotransferase (GGCT)/AIG2-like uncharacterized protein YtfP
LVDKPEEEATLFVYGSLLNPVRRHQVIRRRVDTLPATLRDYELCRKRYFYVRKRPGLSTPGLLLLNLTPCDFRELDRYEEIPRLYKREKTEVSDGGANRVRCWIYLPTSLGFTDSQ